MFPVYKINDEQAENLLKIREDFLNDVKAKEIKPSKLSETISAFANAAGGDIYIGISENKENKTKHWDGFADPEDANDIPQVLLQAHPFGNHLIFEYLECEKLPGLVLHITFENEWVEVTESRIENSLSILHFLMNIIPNGEPKTYLENQELIKPGHSKVCGVLLFCDEPAIYLPKRSSIKIMRYKTKEDDIGREFLDGNPTTIEGDIYNLIFNSVRHTKGILEGIQKLTETGLETIKYPDETLHEVITNAVLHRDYSIVADVQIRVFDNRVEVESPGKLPGHVTTKNILHTQSARNPSLVRLINKFPDPPNKDVGEGLNTAFKAMELLRLKKPIINEAENSVVVIIPSARIARLS